MASSPRVRDAYDAVMDWPVSAVRFIPAIALMREAQRRNRWVEVRAILSADQDVWDAFIFQGGISVNDLAELAADALGIPKHRIIDFAREAIAMHLKD